MSFKIAIIVTLAVLLAACSNKEETPPPAATGNKMTPAEEPVVEKMTALETKGVEEATKPSVEAPVAVATASNETATANETASTRVDSAALTKADALDLANKSGCLACHSVEKKVVGPAWQDVGSRYKSDAGAKAKLIDKVKKGGKGNWTEVTGGIPMPPYSPRVPDDTIDKLVTFVLSLPEI